MTTEQIRMNILAREIAEQMIQLAEAEGAGCNAQRMWELIATHAVSKLSESVVIASNNMSDEEAVRFEDFKIPCGKYQYATVRTVLDNDPEYLVWLAENEFNKGLVAYMKSPYRKKQVMQALAQNN